MTNVATTLSEGPYKRGDILVVDDTLANLQLLTEMLKKHGHRVRPVRSGKLAIQAVQSEKPDLILLDINMPDMNGYEVCEHLKAIDELKDIPILFISALDETIDKIKAFAAGGLDYVTKPFQFEEVEARVQTHLKLRRLQTKLEEQNRQLQEKNDQLKKLEDLQESLTDMVIHDMRSPLTGILLNLEILQADAETKLDSNDMHKLKGARFNGGLLVNMINSLLDVSRMEQGQMPLNMTRADMDVLIQNALDSLGSLMNKVSLYYQKHSPPLKVDCDANLVTRVIANLLGNAIKYAPQGSAVSIGMETVGDGIKLRITDAGSGIAPEYHEMIFEKFKQVAPRQLNNRNSTGLGLTFCKLAVEAHHGVIGVESELGKGSTFWFSLPT